MHGHQPNLSLKSDFFQKILGEKAGRAGQGGNSKSGWWVGKSGEEKVELAGRNRLGGPEAEQKTWWGGAPDKCSKWVGLQSSDLETKSAHT